MGMNASPFARAAQDAVRIVPRATDDSGLATALSFDRRYLAPFVSDSWDKKLGFAPIATRLGALLGERFKPIDHIAVVRGNRDLEKPNFHKAAAEGNFFLRGFTHLLVFKKERAARLEGQSRRASTSDQ
jgi:hypothetical protein